MLDFIFDRRNFLRIGGIGTTMSAVGLTEDVIAQESSEDTSVVWVWLGGGPTQFETFHAPTKDVPVEWRPVNGSIYDPKTNINLGADWSELSKHTEKLNVINSFSHKENQAIFSIHKSSLLAKSA